MQTLKGKVAVVARATRSSALPHGLQWGVLYAVTTGEVENPKLNSIGLGVLASEVVWVPFSVWLWLMRGTDEICSEFA